MTFTNLDEQNQQSQTFEQMLMNQQNETTAVANPTNCTYFQHPSFQNPQGNPTSECQSVNLSERSKPLRKSVMLHKVFDNQEPVAYIQREEEKRVAMREVPVNSLSLAYLPSQDMSGKAFHRRLSNIETSKQLQDKENARVTITTGGGEIVRGAAEYFGTKDIFSSEF